MTVLLKTQLNNVKLSDTHLCHQFFIRSCISSGPLSWLAKIYTVLVETIIIYEFKIKPIFSLFSAQQ